MALVRKETWLTAYAHVFSAEQLGTISAEGDARGWRRFLEAAPPRTAAFVAVRDDRVVGFTSVGVARPGGDPSLGELFTIYVLPTESGHGVGRELMSAALAALREERFGEAILWVIEDNPRTRRFYELAGWHLDGEAKDEEWLETRIREVRYRITL